MQCQVLSSKSKALEINLDTSIYGTIAEIGAGQEVAREFFKAGGASGTIAKTISAYDKTFSDALYHPKKAGRYVSEGRLKKMLDYEFTEVVSLLGQEKGSFTRFFAFADTIETLNFRKDNKGQGWMGVRFQSEPEGDPNEVILHILLHENDGIQQQNTIGMLGINLIYACFNYTASSEQFLLSLLDNLSADRVEVNMVSMSGPSFKTTDNRLLSVQLVKNGMTPVAMFDRNGEVCQPGDMIYKKDVMVLRGSFRPITYVGFDMLKEGYALLKKDQGFSKENTVVLCEMTINNLLDDGDFNERDFLDRVDLLNGMGQHVMITAFQEFFRLTSYLSYVKINSMKIVLSADTLSRVFDHQYYEHLKGGLLEGMGRLFLNSLQLYVYPWLSADGKVISSEEISFTGNQELLYQYLKAENKILDIKKYKKDWLSIKSHIVLDMIRSDDREWEKMVPVYIAEHIKKRKLFGYSPDFSY